MHFAFSVLRSFLASNNAIVKKQVLIGLFKGLVGLRLSWSLVWGKDIIVVVRSAVLFTVRPKMVGFARTING